MPYKVIINYAAQPSTPEIDSQFCSSGTRLCERRQLWRHLILPQHLLPWHSVCWNTVIPSSDMLQTQEKWGKRVYFFFFFFKCSTSKSITCILWVKPARHKATHRLVEQTLWLFCHELSFGIAKFLVFVRQIRAGCAAQTRGIFGSGKSSFHLRQSPKGKIIKRLQDSTSPNW